MTAKKLPGSTERVLDGGFTVQNVRELELQQQSGTSVWIGVQLYDGRTIRIDCTVKRGGLVVEYDVQDK